MARKDRGPLCGAKTMAGGSCRWPRATCKFHLSADREPAAAVINPVVEHEEPQQESSALPEGQDLRELGWWIIENTVSSGLTTQQASVVASVMRVLVSLGPAPDDEETRLREIELQAHLMHGFPPRSAEEWELAAQLYDDSALREFRRWRPLDEPGNREGD